MAANKFATMLQKNTNKITVVLTYAVLEWTLIFLLLLNSMLSYMITKFADYFGLKPPCFWCSNLDPLFKAGDNRKHIDLMCKSHSREVSELGFCETHHRLAESKGMCGKCLGFGIFPLVNELKMIHGGDEMCSCCGVSLVKEGSNYIVIKSSCNPLIKEESREIEEKSGFEAIRVETEVIFDEKEGLVLENGIVEVNPEREMENTPKHLEFFIDSSGHDLVPVDFTAEEEEDGREVKNGTETDDLKERKFAVFKSMEIEEDENSLVFHAKNCFSEREGHESTQNNKVQILDSQEPQEKQVAYASSVSEESSRMQLNETEVEVSIGTEIPDLDIADDLNSNKEGPSTSCANAPHFHHDHGCKQDQEKATEFANEGSLDGSVMSEMDLSDPISTIEWLRSALKSGQKALQALYTELEEERSASAIAASQTMAMINRLQEEKATVQMEALQYQRMMDEQAEYDQEALQLLNELMVKRDKERQEVEKELEIYKKRVFEYESKEKMAAILRRSKDCGSSARSAFSSVSCSNSEEGDGLSLDLNNNNNNQEVKEEVKEQEGFYNTPVDGVLDLDFEDERVAILEQLKALEVKMINMDYEAEREIEGLKGEANGDYYAKEEMDESKILSSMGKSLLPHFDAVSDDNGDYDPNVADNYDLSNKRAAVEEELDCLHERLQALEADREFLKNCLNSLKKGDKGMDLLQEILQHLRDLRNIDLRLRNGCLV
ncbi:unnamed protein product [Cuscuta europaea]|uniref:GTD-binding domain-containing protein n=1 Tax=Cuscuta europaea TaxID=41803 RepID=A0A9P1EMH3_CUSEU|nr:unnamed protein product [Cuscuta europaea]